MIWTFGASTPYFKMVRTVKRIILPEISDNLGYIFTDVQVFSVQSSVHRKCCRYSGLSSAGLSFEQIPFKTYGFSLLPAHLQPFSNCLQKIWDDGVVPQVSKPNSRTIYVYRTGEEEPWTWKGKFRYYTQITIMICIKNRIKQKLPAPWRKKLRMREPKLLSGELLFLRSKIFSIYLKNYSLQGENN